MRGGEESSGCAVTQSKLWRALQGLPAATCRQMAGAEPCSRECAARAGLLMRAGDATRAGADFGGCGRCGASRRLNLFYFRHTCQVDESVFKVNYLGPVALTKAVVPGMLARESGHVVAISSVQGIIGLPARTAYSASKHALHGFFDGLRAGE